MTRLTELLYFTGIKENNHIKVFELNNRNDKEDFVIIISMRGVLKILKNNLIKEEINVKNNKITIIKVGNYEYISLTDLARYADEDDPRYPIQNWMRNKDVISYLGLWEFVNNPNFKRVEFDTFKNESGSNKFKISPQKWINETNAIGIISKSGNGGGTYAHSDIALEFASWLSPEFKFYLITEFERLKRQESYQYKVEWQASRFAFQS